MTMFRNKFLIAVVFGALSISLQAYAQFSSSVQGNVLDTSGSAIGKATVTLVNVDTKITQSREADDTGAYRFVSIAPGNYEVSATATGFTTAKVAFALRTEEN